MLAVHKWNAVVSGQFKSFHEPIFLPCLSRHGAQPWNPTTECKINGQSKQHIHNFNPLTVPTRHPPDGYMPGPLPARLPCSHSLLMRNPTRRRTFGCTDHEVRRSLIRFEEGLAARLFWARGWAQAEYIWNNPPAPLESGSIRGTQPRFSWPLSKQLTSGIMHHFLWLPGKQMDIVVISVTQREEPTYISVNHGNSFLRGSHSSVSRSQSRIASDALLRKSFLLDVYLFVHIIIIPNQILNYCIHRVTLTWSGCAHQS